MKEPILAAESMVPIISTHYDVAQPIQCELLRRGFNDHYLVRAGDEKYVWRVYMNHKYYISGPDDFRFELELLTFLSANGVPVASPIRRGDGDLLGAIDVAEGRRYSALFHFAAGQELDKLKSKSTPAFATQLGEMVGRLHQHADNFQPIHPRYHLDFRYLIDEPLETLERYLVERGKGDLAFFQPFAAELTRKIDQIPRRKSSYGIIHGDLHGRNLHYDDRAGFCIFDFDHCAYGWRVYDLITFSHFPPELWTAFLAGYESIRPLSELEREAILLFKKLRTIWDFGDMLKIFPLWGEEPKDEFLDESLNRLRKLM